MLSLMFLRQKDFGKAIRYIDETISPETSDTDVLQIKASILEELYRLEEAIGIYEKALEIDPKDHRIRYSLGNCLEKSGRRSRGLAEMEKILVEKPDDPGALNFIGYTLVSSGTDIEKGEQLIRRAIEIKPEDGYILDSMAWVLFKKGQTEEALIYLEKAVQKVPSDPIIFDHLGDVQAALNRRDAAIESYRKSLSANPDNILVQEKLRQLEGGVGDPSR
jgi:tetratricopeptide (TPR) repeat protein